MQSSSLVPYTTLFRSIPGERALEEIVRRIAVEERRREDEDQPFLRVRDVQVRVHRMDLALEVVGVLGARRVERSEEHTSELQSRRELVCRLLLEKKNI